MNKVIVVLCVLLGCVASIYAADSSAQQATEALHAQIMQVQTTAMNAIAKNNAALSKEIKSNQVQIRQQLDMLQKKIQQVQSNCDSKVQALQVNIQNELKTLNK